MKRLPPFRTLALFLPLLLMTLAIPNPASALLLRPDSTDLPPEVRAEMAQAAQDTLLPAWQRNFMMDLARTGRTPAPGSQTADVSAGTVATDWSATTDGGWSAFFLRTRSRNGEQAGAIYDPVRRRFLIFGGSQWSQGDWRGSLNDVWSLSMSETPTWTELTPTGAAPVGRVFPGMAYDPVRDRVIVYGGLGDSGPLGNVWALSLGDAPAWTELTPGGTTPGGRFLHSFVYDPVRDRMIVCGGVGYSGDRADVWALSLGDTPAWTQLAPSGAGPSSRLSATYDSARNRIIAYSYSDNGIYALTLGDTPTWSLLASADYLDGVAYDSVRDRLLAFRPSVDTQALSLGDTPAWTQLPTTYSAVVTFGTFDYDAVQDRVVMLEWDLQKVGALSLRDELAWADVTPPAPTQPEGRWGHGAIYDPVRDRLMVFGGYDHDPNSDVLTLALSGAPVWASLAIPSATWPQERAGQCAIYDPVRDRLLVFGGDEIGYGPSFNDIWALSLAGTPAWAELAPTGTPPSDGMDRSAIYDPMRDRMVIFGGVSFSGEQGEQYVSYDDGVWALSLSGAPAWTELTPAGTSPGARYGHSAIYDPVRDRMVIFGGVSYSANNCLCYDDVWALSLSGAPAWTELTPTGTLPEARYGQTAIYDPVRDRMVMFGGETAAYAKLGGTWALSLGDAPAWVTLAPIGMAPSAREDHVAVYDPLRDRMIVQGGDAYGFPYCRDALALTWGSPAPAGVTCPGDAVWMAGASVPLEYGITNPFAFGQIADYTLTSARDWPGFPITGSVTVGAGGTTAVPITVPAPDSAASGANTLIFAVTLRTVPQHASCSHDLSDAVVPVELALVSADAEPGLVRLTWYAADKSGVEATVYRRTAGTAWSAVGMVASAGTGQIVYEDRAVTPGACYGYRLGVQESGGETFVGEAWVSVPVAAQFALAGARPNPAVEELAVAFSLPDASSARLEAYDLAGRRVAGKDVGALGAGGHVVRLGEGVELNAGVYLVRLTQAGRTLTTRVVIVH
jgi:hypothetical protein